MNNDRLCLARSTLEQGLREHLRDFHGFERSGASPLELLGMDSHRATRLLAGVGDVLGIALPSAPTHRGVFQTPNTLLAFLCAAAMEHALQALPRDSGAGRT